MIYRHIAASERAFVQQLAVAYVNHGYWYYVTGSVPGHKNVMRVDEKLLARYDVAISKWARARRKRQGLANVHYLRHGQFFVLIATRGFHPFFEEEGESVKDIRREPIRFSGYSISYRRGVDRKWHASVRIHPVEYNGLKSFYLDLATHSSLEVILRELRRIPFEPYAAVRRQLLNVLRAVNRARKTAGYELVPTSAIRLRRRVVKAFDASREDGLHAAALASAVERMDSGCQLSVQAFAAGLSQQNSVNPMWSNSHSLGNFSDKPGSAVLTPAEPAFVPTGAE
jgi:hypothetical protein